MMSPDLPDKRDEVIGDGDIDLSLRIGLNVAEIADVAILIARCTVRLAERVEVRAGRGAAIS
jgi:hypothetical protein